MFEATGEPRKPFNVGKIFRVAERVTTVVVYEPTVSAHHYFVTAEQSAAMKSDPCAPDIEFLDCPLNPARKATNG